MGEDKKILFSIIIPTFNRSKMIPVAIDSVLGQTYSNWELIIIDDGATDNTKEVIKRYADPRIKYYYQENKGRSAARNLGIDKAKGEYVSFLDDDDYYLPGFLDEFLDEIMKQNCPEAVFMCRQIEKENETFYKYDKNRLKYKNNLIKMFFYHPNVQSFCTSQKILNEVRFDERFEIGEDFHLFIRIFLNYPSFFINKYLCVNVFHEKGTMYNELIKLKFLEPSYNRIIMLDNIFNKYEKKCDEKNILNDFIKRYNKINYFYANALAKKKKFNDAFNHLKSIKFKPIGVSAYSYSLLIIGKIIYFKIQRMISFL